MKRAQGQDVTVAPEAIRAQVRRILASDAFVRSRRMQRFLQFIVEETLAGRANQLGEYAVGTSVFDRGPDFEPALDPIVRNDARRLRLKLLEYYRQAGGRPADRVLIEIPKGGYVPLFRPSPLGDPAGASLPGPPRRLAVLPFEVLSPTSESSMECRAFGLSLTANLTNLEGLEAVAHSYLQEQSLREAVAELQLSHVIHGSLSRSSDRCHIIISLIQASAGTQMWAREFDFEASEMRRAQAEIAAQVVREVAVRLGLPHSQTPRRLALAA